MARIRLEMGVEPDKVFDGELVTQATSERPGSLNWSELELYRHDDGRYVLYVIGRSVVYHVLGNACGAKGTRKGKPVEASKVQRLENLGPHAVPCPDCHAPELWELRKWSMANPAAPVPLVDCEVNRFMVSVHESPDAVVEELRFPEHVMEERRRRGLPARSFSGPAERLLEAAKLVDEGFAAALDTVQQL